MAAASLPTGEAAWLLCSAVAVVAVIPLLVSLALAVLLRSLRVRGQRRRAKLEERATPALVATLSDPDGSGSLDDVLRLSVLLRGDVGRTLDQMVVPLIGQLKGSERQRLVQVLHHRGSLMRAARTTRHWRAKRRLAAVELLGAAGDASHAGLLVARLDDRDEAVRLASVRAIGRIGAVWAVTILLSKLDDTGKNRLPVHAITMAVLRCGLPATGHLLACLATGSDTIRCAAADILGWLGAVEAAPALIPVATVPDDPAALSAARALERIGLPVDMLLLEAAGG